MNDTKSRLIQASIELFSQYGVKRTSMGDIADRANVSRQTLYVNFENKDEMLAAAMKTAVNEIFASLNSQWSECDSVENVLNAYFDIAIVGTYDLLQSQPDSRDILLGVGKKSQKVSEDINKKKVKLLTEQLLPYSDQLKTSGTDVKALSQFIVSTTSSFKYSVKTKKELKGLLKTLKVSVVALVGT